MQEALAASGAGEVRVPTRGEGETLEHLRADRSAFEDFDADAAGVQGYGYVRLSQLALEHLLGAR